MKKIIIGIMVGIVISCTVGVLAASIVPSTIVTYQDKTVNTALDELYDSVNLLKTKGNAEANQILTGKKVIVKGQEITGTMANRGKLNWNPSSSTTYTVPAGYYSGGTLNSSGSYNAGYSAGVTAADDRANPSSKNYQTGYNNGLSIGKSSITTKVIYNSRVRGNVSCNVTSGKYYFIYVTADEGYPSVSGFTSIWNENYYDKGWYSRFYIAKATSNVFNFGRTTDSDSDYIYVVQLN